MKVLLLITTFLLLTACSQTIVQPEPPSEELDQIYRNLQSNFAAIAKNGGGVSPETYEEMRVMLLKLENNNYPIEKTSFLRTQFEQLQRPQAPVYENIPSEVEVIVPEVTPTCQENKPVFVHHITDINQLTSVQTPPMLVSGELKTHSYMETKGKRVPIYAPVDMVLTTGAFYKGGPYTLDFKVGCDLSLRLGHITEPLEEIKKVFPSVAAEDSRSIDLPYTISFKAGDLIAYTTGTSQAGNWDFGMYDAQVINRYAPSLKWNNSWVYTTAICPFDYFTPELKSEYSQKYNLVKYKVGGPDGESFCK